MTLLGPSRWNFLIISKEPKESSSAPLSICLITRYFYLLNKGLDPDFVREQVGHKDLQTTYNSYTFSTTRKEKQLEQLEKALID